METAKTVEDMGKTGKPYLIINIVGGKLKVVRHRISFEGALDCAAEMLGECCDTPEKEIRGELSLDMDFCTKDGNVWVGITQAEDN